MEPRKLLAILFFCVVARMYFAIGVNYYVGEYYAGLAGQTMWNLSLFGICCYFFKLKQPDIKVILGNFDSSKVFTGAILGLLMLMFTFGESAATTLIVAQSDPAQAYKAGRFHEEFYGAMPFLSMHVFTYLLAAVVMPALFEEFFFRGLLFPAFSKKYSQVTSAVICSVIFTLLHYMKHVNINTFLFAFVACMIYARGGSLYTVIVAHAVYNFFAFISHYYFDAHGTRSIENISSLADWIPELTMLAISTLVFVVLAIRHRKFLRSCLKRPDKRITCEDDSSVRLGGVN